MLRFLLGATLLMTLVFPKDIDENSLKLDFIDRTCREYEYKKIHELPKYCLVYCSYKLSNYLHSPKKYVKDEFIIALLNLGLNPCLVEDVVRFISVRYFEEEHLTFSESHKMYAEALWELVPQKTKNEYEKWKRKELQRIKKGYEK